MDYDHTLEDQDLLRESSFIEWLYKNYSIGNGDMLISYLENGHTFDTYLKEHGLSPDSELTKD